MAATAQYDFIVDVNPPTVHFERKAILKSDTLDFTFGKWTYYSTPFGSYKSKMKARGNKLVERIINLGMIFSININWYLSEHCEKITKDDQNGPPELKHYQLVTDGENDFLKIDIKWGDHTAQFYLK